MVTSTSTRTETLRGSRSPSTRELAARRTRRDICIDNMPFVVILGIILAVSTPATCQDLQQAASPTTLTRAVDHSIDDSGAASSSSMLARIVGGQPAVLNRYPYMVQLWSTRPIISRFFCAGTIIHPQAVLTAAHCFDTWISKAPEIRAGRNTLNDGELGTQLRQSRAVIEHEGHHQDVANANDLAIIILDKPLDNPDLVQLADAEISKDLKEGKVLEVMGWGATEEVNFQPTNVLQEVPVQYISRAKCDSLYARLAITEDMICAGWDEGERDACQGDSGGPLVVKGGDWEDDVQVGVVSWGSGCARPGTPGVYANIAFQRAWIEKVLKENGIDPTELRQPGGGDSPPEAADECVSKTSQEYLCQCVPGYTTDDGVNVEFKGCSDHLSEYGDDDLFCYTLSSECDSAKASSTFQGAEWRLCNASEPSPESCAPDEQGAAPDEGDGEEDDPCQCAEDGVSGGQETRFTEGCAQYFSIYGMDSYWCMVVGGAACESATPSRALEGAAFRECNVI